MSLFEGLLARAGYVKLSRYGLGLAADGRLVPLTTPAEPAFAAGPAMAAPVMAAPVMTAPVMTAPVMAAPEFVVQR